MREEEPERQAREWREEAEVMAILDDPQRGYIPLTETPEGALLPAECQHLVFAIDRLNRRGVIVRLSNGQGPRWAKSAPGARP